MPMRSGGTEIIMKKRISFILIAVMLLPAFCIMKAGATVTASDEVACRLERLKNLYPTGTAQEEFYNDFIYDWETDTMSLGYKDLSGWGSWECMAWGCKVYDTLWGQSISTGQTLTDVSYICIGDYVRFNSTAQYDHSIVITDIDGNKLYYTDCNGSGYSGKIKWDRTITKSDLQTKVNKKLVMSSGYGYIRHQSGNEYKSFNVSELFNISFDANGGELDKSSKYQFCADAVNEGRGEDMIIVYTGIESTRTNEYGIEYTVDKYGKVTDKIYGEGNARVPDGGFVISGHGQAIYRLSGNIEVGDYVCYNKINMNITVYEPEQGSATVKRCADGEKYSDLPTPTRSGYIFKGWFTDKENGDLITEDSVFCNKADQTLYAHWEMPCISAKLSVSGTAYTVTSEAVNIDTPCVIIISAYKGDRLVAYKAEEYNPGNEIISKLEGDFDEIKIMAFENADSLKPVCKAASVNTMTII